MRLGTRSGVHYYKQAPDDGFIPGLMRPRLAGYHVGDIEFSAAFDVDVNKVGLDLSQAIWAKPNNTVRFGEVPHLGVPVQRGMTHDGLGHYLSQIITKAPGPTVDIAGILRETRTDVVVNFLPVGSEMATKWYVEQILDAGAASSTASPCSSRGKSTGGGASRSMGCPWWATTSSHRWAPPSSTGS